MLLSGIQTWKKRIGAILQSDWVITGRSAKQRRCHRRTTAGVAGVESLETRTMLTSYVVDSSFDTVDASDGQTTLREAIEQANASAGHDTITFQISSTGPQTIALTSVLPTVNDQITIDGSTQPGITIDASGVTGNVLRLGSNADGSTLKQFAISNAQDTAVQLVGVMNALIDGLDLSYTGSRTSGTGLKLFGSDDNHVRNVIANDRSRGIQLNSADGNLIEQSTTRRADHAGIKIDGNSNANVFQQNDASESVNGIRYLGNGLGNQFLDNDLSHTTSFGLFLANDSQFVVRGNDFTDSSAGVRLSNMDGITLEPSAAFDLDVSTVTGTGLELFSVSNSTIDELDLSFAGSGSSGTGLKLFGSDHNTLSNLTVGNRVNGIHLTSSDQSLISCSSLIENGAGLRIDGTTSGTTIIDSQIEGNGIGVQNLAASLVLAEYNYWGASDGPGNLGGSGDTYSGNVDVDPFLTSLPDCLIDVHSIEIDLKPDSEIDTVNLASNGVLPVVIYSTSDFDASLVDVGTVTFTGAGVVQSALKDVDGDGDLDLVLHFRIQEMVELETDYLEALEADLADNGVVDDNHQTVAVTLEGQTSEGLLIEGTDTIDTFFAGKAFRNALNSL